MADDVEGQLPWLRAEQLGFQEGGPLLLQQLLAAYVVLGEPAASGPRSQRTGPTHLLPIPIGSQAASPPPGPGLGAAGRPCRLEPPWMCTALQRSQTRWLSPQRRNRRPRWMEWLPRTRRPLREAGQTGLGTEHRGTQGSLGDTVGWIPRARAGVVSHPTAC